MSRIAENRGPLEFSSAFQYSSSVSYDEFYETKSTSKHQPLSQSCLHHLIITVFYLFFFLSFPISAWFCIKRIKPLQRCILFRLGQRMPIKGPGLVIKFPLIDAAEVVDLVDHDVVISENDQQFLTSDGSILQLNGFKGKLSVYNAIRCSTTLKDAKLSAEQFVKLSFANMLASTHLEDMERKPDVVINKFKENCNLYLNKWGWEINFLELPKVTVISRADPVKPIMSKFKGLFNPVQSSTTTEGPNDLFANLMKLQTPLLQAVPPDLTFSEGTSRDKKAVESEEEDAPVIIGIQKIAKQYSAFITENLHVSIEILETNSLRYFTYYHQTGSIMKNNSAPEKVHIKVTAKTHKELAESCEKEDLSALTIHTSVF